MFYNAVALVVIRAVPGRRIVIGIPACRRPVNSLDLVGRRTQCCNNIAAAVKYLDFNIPGIPQHVVLHANTVIQGGGGSGECNSIRIYLPAALRINIQPAVILVP